MSHTRASLLPVIALLAPALLVFACDTPGALPDAASVDLKPIPEVDLTGPDAAARDQVSAARAEVDRLLGRSPRDARALGQAYGRLGMIYNAYQYLDAAAAAYRNASSLDPREPDWLYYLAFVHQLRGELAEATALYERVIGIDGDDPTTRLRLAETRLEANDLDAARAHFERALELDPDSAAGRYGLGRVAAAAGAFEEAVGHFEETLAVQPVASQVRYPLAMALRRTGDEAGARRHLELGGDTEVAFADRRLAAVATLGRSFESHRQRGEVALAEDRCRDAEAAFREALALAPDHRDARGGLAASLRRCGDLAGAVSEQVLSSLAGPRDTTAVAVSSGTTPALADFGVPEKPDLSRQEPAVRARLDKLHESVAEALDAGRRTDAAAVLGQLGQLYTAYGFEAAATRHFLVARQLHSGEPSWSYYLAVLAQARDPRTAREELRAFLDQRPRDLAGWIRLGQIELELGRASEASPAFERALEIEPGNAAALFGSGRLALAEGDPGVAVAALEQALEAQPEAGRIHHVLGQAYRRLGDRERAREHLALASDRDVFFNDPLIDRLGDVKTLTAFEVVLAMASDPEVTNEDHLGFALSKLGGVSGAAEQLDAVLARPDTLPAGARARLHYVAGGLWVKRGDDEAAIRHFRAAVDLASAQPEVHVKLGNALARRGELRAAVDAYSAALAGSGDYRPALRKRATAYARLGDLAAATEDLRRLARLDPADVDARIQLARALEQGGDAAGARELLEEALGMADLGAGPSASLRAALGDLARRGERLDAAIGHYRAALELAPGAPDSRHRLAAVLAHLGRYEEAIEHYSRLLDQDAGHLDGRLGLAASLSLLGRHDEARRHLEEGLRAFPNEPRLTSSLERLRAITAES
ncbi:MAG: tetratricopeptide repeat protein [bacterium]|nr:tetratricopeptide repeat protein [bacterium]